MMVGTIAFAAIGGLCMATQSAAASQPYEFQKTALENGLRLITLEDFSCPIVAVQVWYHVGSKDERPDRQGFAHMFEHMMFRGTDLLKPEEHFELIRNTGGTANAFTSFDYTAYVNTVPANQLELVLWLEAERMLFLKVDQENFETERKVVIEERRQDLNEPYGTVFERILPVVFTQHPYRWLPIGQIDQLNAASAGELKQFWDTYYVPNNATLVIVGAVGHEEAQTLAKKYFGWIPRCPDPPRNTVREPEQAEPREAVVHEPIGPAPLVRYVYRTVPKGHPDYVPLQVVSDILGGGESSRLYQDLVRVRKICQEAASYNYGLEQDGIVMLGAELVPGGDLEAVVEAINSHVARVLDEPVSEKELAKVKNQLRRRVVTDTLTVARKAHEIGQAAIQCGSPDWLNRQLDAVAAVTIEDVQRVASTYLRPERRSLARILPDRAFQYVPESPPPTEPVPVLPSPKAHVQRPDWFPKQPPVHKLLEGLPETPMKERRLPNGLKVVVLPNHELPFVTIMLGLRHGAWTENPETPGVASMALEMLTRGTEHYSAAELAELIEFNALTLKGEAGANGWPTMDVGNVTATGLSDKAPLAFELLAEVMFRPTFPEEEIAILKEQRRLSLTVKENDPSYLAERELRRILYKDHPYARTPTGELADVDRVRREMLQNWWKTHARPDAAVLYVAGDVKPRTAWRLVEKHFGQWRADGPTPEADYPAPPAREKTHIYLLDRPGSVQSQIRLGQLSITRNHPDYHASRVFAQIFGSGFNSRLNKTIRIERGLTYAVWGYFNPNRSSGEFLCSTFTKTETTAETVQGLLEVILGMRTQPPTPEELEGAKSYLVGSFARNLETSQEQMNYQWLIEYNDLPKDYLRRAMAAYAATQDEDILRIAHEVVDPEALTIVVVGETGSMKESLGSIAPITSLEPAPNPPESR